MVGKTSTCEECLRTCQLIHQGKQGLEPKVTSFFKVMFGKDFKNALVFPPNFAKTVKDLVDKEIKLEDSSGDCWSLTVSYYKDVLAFCEGWSEFSVDKDLKVGDFVIFNHIKRGHFLVQTFGRDGCNKLNTGKKHPLVNKARTSLRSQADVAQQPQRSSKTNMGKDFEMVKEQEVVVRKQASGGRAKRALEPLTRQEGGNSSTAPKTKEVKSEPADNLPSIHVTAITCLAVTNGNTVDLPDRLPLLTFPRRGEYKAKVILEDPKGKVWDGNYAEKFGHRILAAPWQKANQENGIRPGDSLVFSLADARLNKYKFDIVRRNKYRN